MELGRPNSLGSHGDYLIGGKHPGLLRLAAPQRALIQRGSHSEIRRPSEYIAATVCGGDDGGAREGAVSQVYILEELGQGALLLGA